MVALHRRLQDAFFSWGWLTPTVLPIAQVLGRAVFNILLVLYFLWGILSLYGQKQKLERPELGLFSALLLAFLISIPGAEDLARAWHKWLRFLIHSMCFVLVLAALQQGEDNFKRLCRAFAMAGVGVLVVLYLHLIYILWNSAEFIPTQQLREDNLPFLLPFLLYGLQWVENRRHRIALRWVLLLSLIFYVVLSEGRAALLSVFVALVLYAVLVERKRLRSVLVLSFLVGTALMTVVSVIHVDSADKKGETWLETLDRISSGRTVLWRQAFTYPPESVITGVGIGNGRYAEKALTLPWGQQVRHFHNLFVDTWYQTGLLGLVTITAWLAFILTRAWGDWKKSPPEDRGRIGLLLSSSFAILTAAQLGPSYGSNLVSIYLMVIFAALTTLHGKIERISLSP